MNRCSKCNKFFSWNTKWDRGTPYRCSDWDNPEPYDEEFFCEPCANKEYEKAISLGEAMYNYWQKPNFQLRAMKELGLIERNFKIVKERV